MSRTGNGSNLVVVFVLTLIPSVALASNWGSGLGDICWLVVGFLFCVPAGLTMVALVIASVVRLASAAPLKPLAGTTTFTLSLVFLGLTVFFSLGCMFLAGFERSHVEANLIFGGTVTVLSFISAVLAWLVRGKARAAAAAQEASTHG